MRSVPGPASASISRFVPTATIRPSLMATACAIESRASTVMIRPFTSTRSAARPAQEEVAAIVRKKQTRAGERRRAIPLRPAGRNMRGILLERGSPSGSEDQLRFVLVVPPTVQRDVSDRRRPSKCVGVDVVKLREGLLGTSPSVGGHEGALTSVLTPDHTLHRPRPLARARFIRSRTDSRLASRLRRRAELLVLDLLPQQPHGALEDGGGVAIRNLPAKKGLKAAKVVMGLLIDGELDPVTLRGGGLDDRARRLPAYRSAGESDPWPWPELTGDFRA